MATRLPHQAAFTLFEIGISLIIIAFGVVTVMMTIPVGIKVQQISRMSLLASAKAMELVEGFSGRIGGERIAEFETPEPWETRPFSYSSTRWDMECRSSRWDAGMIPLPLDIAKRLDSDGDEIQNLLASGAYLYYADPKILPGVDPRFVNNEAPNEAMKLIFAVSGYAQNNAIPVFPWKAWPYRAAYPSPPLYTALDRNKQMMPMPSGDPTADPQQMSTWSSRYLMGPGNPRYASDITNNPSGIYGWNSWEGWCNGQADPSLPMNRDLTMDAVFQAAVKYFDTLKTIDLSSEQRNDPADLIIQPLRVGLTEAVVAFCKDKFNPGRAIDKPTEYEEYYSPPIATPSYRDLSKQFENNFRTLCQAAEVLPGRSEDPVKALLRAKIALRVQCMRFMAFASGTYYLKRVGAGETVPNLASFSIDSKALSLDRLRYFHDCCVQAAAIYAASFPYDWGAPRPITRCIMMDEPLIEFDLFHSRSRPFAGTSPSILAEMWKPVSAQAITSIGLPAFFPGVLQYNASGVASWDVNKSPFTKDTRAAGHPFWGDANHFTLTRPFQAAERCRQLVFWSVDWQSYEDAETAPGAPLDASRVPYHGMHMQNLNNHDSRYSSEFWSIDSVYDALHLRNPERNLQFTKDMSQVSTGKDLSGSDSIQGLSHGGSDVGLGNINVAVGAYGADRNHNYILDRGTLPRSVRQRAQTVGRFQFYDPRIPVTLR